MNFDDIKYTTLGLYAIGIKDTQRGRFCGLIVDALMPFIPNPATIVISVRSDSYSCQKILQEKSFSISVLGKDTKPEVFAMLGYQSGASCNKWEGLDFFEQNGLPFLSDAIEVMSAKVINHFQQGAYTLIIAEIEYEKVLKNEEKVLTYAEYQDILKDKVIEVFNNQQKGYKMTENTKEQWVCKVCGYIYDGDIPFEQLPEDWTCPLCGVGKEQFEKVEQ